MKGAVGTGHRGWKLGAMVVVGTLALLVTSARAEQKDNAGKQLYLKYCSPCHGESGKGDGVVATFLRPKPTDLTQISKKSEFPFMDVASAIDGSKLVRAHGDSEMPVWGELFKEEATSPMARQAEVRGRVMLITEYVRSIQAK